MGRIRRRAAAVIRFIDTVTQAPVSGSSLYIQIRQKSPILWKEDGYVVVMEQPGVDSLDISVSGGYFSPAQFHVEVLRDVPVRIRYIHLLPASGYPFTREMAVIRGNCPPEGLYAVRMEDAGRYRLMEDLTGGDSRIRLWGNEKFSPGQLLLLNEGQRYEPVTLLAEEEETEYGYCIREQIRESWKKGKTKVCSAIRIFPDEQGRFCAAYDRVGKNGEKIRFLSGNCCLSEAGTTGGAAEPEAGTVNSTAAESQTGAMDDKAARMPDGKAAKTPGGKGIQAATDKIEETPDKGTQAATDKTEETPDGKGTRAATYTEVEIREGQEMEIHVGG